MVVSPVAKARRSKPRKPLNGKEKTEQNPNGAGRPTKYNEETVQRLEQAITAGSTYRLACQYAGISEDLLAIWRRERSEFSERLARAESNAALRWLAKIEQIADQENDWRALAWKLERRYPQEYGKTTQDVQHSGTVVQEHRGTIEIRAVDYRVAMTPLLTDEGENEGEVPALEHRSGTNGKAPEPA
jgi:hypothetical protein